MMPDSLSILYAEHVTKEQIMIPIIVYKVYTRGLPEPRFGGQ